MAAVVTQARASAEVTHAHPEGQAGAIAVAIAAAWASGDTTGGAPDFFAFVLAHTPEGDTRQGLARAAELPPAGSPRDAALILGSGSQVLSADTVPFALWCAAHHLDDYAEAMWTTVAGLGDRDTTCAIAGGIVALSAGRASIPSAWLAARESLEIEDAPGQAQT